MDERVDFGRILELNESTATLDAIDRKLIYLLSEDSRMPISALAKQLRISRDVVAYRIKKLIDRKVILRFSPYVDLSFFHLETYHVYFITTGNKKSERDRFIERLSKHSNTKSVMEYTTKWEIEWIVVATSLIEFDALLTSIATEFSHVILEKHSVELIKGFKSSTLPLRQKYEPWSSPRTGKYVPNKTDVQLLSLLCEDCRISSYELSEKLKLSPSSVRFRIKSLRRAGVLRRFSVLVDLNALGYHLYTIGAVVKSLSEHDEHKLEEIVRQNRFVIRAVKVLGHWDLMFVIVADTINNFHKTVKLITDNFADILITYESLIAFKEHTFKFLPRVIEKRSFATTPKEVIITK